MWDKSYIKGDIPVEAQVRPIIMLNQTTLWTIFLSAFIR